MATAGASRGPGPERAHLARIPASGTVRLDAEEGHHLVRVRRARPGDEVVLFDGRGGSFLARLTDARPEGPTLEVLSPYPDREPPRVVTVASAVPGPSRLDDLVSTLAELGASAFVPLRCARSERDGAELVERRRDRLERLVREAAKVSGRSRFLSIDAPRTPAELLAGTAAGARAESPGGGGGVPRGELVLLDPDPTAPALGALLRGGGSPIRAVTLLVGPEGGFTDGEVAAARAAGVQLASVSACALRTEVAAIAAAAIALGEA